MAATVAMLAERALRHIGVAIVPVSERPMLETSVSVTQLAQRALQLLGVAVTSTARPGAPTIVPADTIATQALQVLGVVASDETPSTLDQAYALARVNAVQDSLVDQAIASWAVTAIPQAVSEEYTLLTALHCAPAFGKQGDPTQLPALEARVRRVALVLESQAVAEARVHAVHDAMVAQGFVSWPDTLIPQAVSEEYVRLTANALAPMFGATWEPAEIAPLEARVRKYSMLLFALDDAQDAVIAVQRRLEAAGRVRWTLQDIPPAAEDPYVMLAADMLAPDYDRPPIQGDREAAERALMVLIALPSSGERIQAEYF
jgi:hypothetical protein